VISKYPAGLPVLRAHAMAWVEAAGFKGLNNISVGYIMRPINCFSLASCLASCLA